MIVNLSDAQRREALGEVMNDKLDVILEYVADIPVMKQDIAILKEDVSELKDDMKVVKAVLRDHESDIRYLKTKVA